MQIYAGKLVIDLATIVVEDAEESEMKNKAHEGISSELMRELMLIVGAAGYASGSVSLNLEKVEDDDESDFSMIRSNVEKSKKEVSWVYNKANISTFKIE